MIYGFTVEGFYTNLFDAFVLEERTIEGSNNTILEKINGGDSQVYGATLEGRFNYKNTWQVQGSLTVQENLYDKTVEWSEELPGTTDFLRTPNSYGYLSVVLLPKYAISGSISAIYTGSMLIPHYGLAGVPGTPENDDLFESDPFFELNTKISYSIPQKFIESNIMLDFGVQNALNQFQENFDTGKNRDSGFIFGPSLPRTFFVGVSVGG